MGEASAVRATGGEPAHTVHAVHTVQNHDPGPKRDDREMRLRAAIHAAYDCYKIHMARLTLEQGRGPSAGGIPQASPGCVGWNLSGDIPDDLAMAMALGGEMGRRLSEYDWDAHR